jgi:hypothetical protein
MQGVQRIRDHYPGHATAEMATIQDTQQDKWPLPRTCKAEMTTIPDMQRRNDHHPGHAKEE